MPACHARSVQQACSSKGRVYVCARALRVQWVVLDVSASIAANIHVSNVHFAPSRGRVRVTSSNQHIASKPITHHVYNDARLQPRACSEYSWDIPRTSNWTEENGRNIKVMVTPVLDFLSITLHSRVKENETRADIAASKTATLLSTHRARLTGTYFTLFCPRSLLLDFQLNWIFWWSLQPVTEWRFFIGTKLNLTKSQASSSHTSHLIDVATKSCRSGY